jgi:hypothetical protein
MIIVRRVGAIVLVAAAVAIWLLMAPKEPAMPVVQVQEPVSDRSLDIRQALSEYKQNDARTQGAPQQAVVNGWVTKDLFSIMAEQQNEALVRDAVPIPLTPVAPHDERIPALVGLLVVGLALALFTAPRPSRATEAAARPMTWTDAHSTGILQPGLSTPTT